MDRTDRRNVTFSLSHLLLDVERETSSDIRHFSHYENWREKLLNDVARKIDRSMKSISFFKDKIPQHVNFEYQFSRSILLRIKIYAIVMDHLSDTSSNNSRITYL